MGVLDGMRRRRVSGDPMAAVAEAAQRSRRGDTTGAARIYRLVAATEHAEAWFTLGGVVSDPDRQALAYQHALDSGRPDVAASAAICLGEVREDQGRVDEAAAAYRRAIDIGDPDCLAKAQFSLGRLCHSQGRTEEAAALLRKAADSGDPTAAISARRMLAPSGRASPASR